MLNYKGWNFWLFRLAILRKSILVQTSERGGKFTELSINILLLMSIYYFFIKANFIQDDQSFKVNWVYFLLLEQGKCILYVYKFPY